MKKVWYVIAVVIIIILIILGIKACEPRTKNLSTEEEYNAFINANIEFTCTISQDPSIILDDALTTEFLDSIYQKWNLPIDDDQAMKSILDKYENDPEIISIIKSNTKNCINGGTAIPYAT